MTGGEIWEVVEVNFFARCGGGRRVEAGASMGEVDYSTWLRFCRFVFVGWVEGGGVGGGWCRL